MPKPADSDYPPCSDATHALGSLKLILPSCLDNDSAAASVSVVRLVKESVPSCLDSDSAAASVREVVSVLRAKLGV